MTESDFKYLKEALATDLAELLSENFGMNISDALDALYNSETYSKLSDPKTGLYYQSSLYVYSFLKNELEFGKFQ